MQKIKVKDVVVQKLEWKLTNRQKNGWIWLNLIFSSVMQLVITITSILTPFNMGSWLIHFSICYGKTDGALTLLVGWQEGHPACKKLEWWSTGMVICLKRDADLHMAQLMPLPLTVSCFIKIQIGFTFLVPAHPGSPGKGAVKRVCECVLNGCVMED